MSERPRNVEHNLGKGGVVSSILTGGTTKFLEIIAVGDSPDRAGLGNVRGPRGEKWEKSGTGTRGGKCADRAGKIGEIGGKGEQGKCAQNARELGDGEVGREES